MSDSLLAVALLGCVAAYGATGLSALETSQQTSRQLRVLQAALQHESDEAVNLIDSRPITVHHDSVFPDTSHFVAVDSAVVEARAELIRSFGNEVGKVLPLRDACSGFLIPPGKKRTSGCPTVSERELIFGLAHQKEDGSWILPFIEIQYTPAGRAVTTYDLFLRNRKDGIAVVGKKPRVAWD